MKRVLVVDTVHPILLAGLRQMNFEVVENYEDSSEKIQENLGAYYGMVVRSRFPIDAKFLRKGSHLRFIARVGAGMENIDLAVAKELNISCFKAPEGNRAAVAEQAIGMLLMLFNNLGRAHAQVKKSIWLREENRGWELEGKTVGIIGFGNMGSAFAQRLQGFGVKIVAYDKYKTNYVPNYVTECTLSELQAQSDVVSIHTPQTLETQGFVNKEFTHSFKKPFYLINTARGSSVLLKDLAESLQSGKILGACLDVLEYEKSSFENLFEQSLPPEFDYLLKSDRVVISPHIAGWTQESNVKMAEVLLQKIAAFEKG